MLAVDWSPLLLSVRTALVAAGAAFMAGTLLGWLVSRMSGRWRSLADALLTLPLVLPPTVVGFALLWLFGLQSPTGRFLINTLGIRIIFSWTGAVIAAGLVALPLIYRAARSAFELIDPVYLQAARTLGLSELSILIRIHLPLAWPGLAGGLVLGFARALGEFGATIMVAGNIPGSTRTLSLAIYDAVQQGDYAQALFWSVLMTAVSWLLIILVNHYRPRWVVRTAPRRRGGASK